MLIRICLYVSMYMCIYVICIYVCICVYMYAFDQSYFRSNIIIGVGRNMKRRMYVLPPNNKFN